MLFLGDLPEFGMRVLEVLRQPLEDKVVTISRVQYAASVTCNANMRPAEVRKFCVPDKTGKNLMQSALNQLQLSARALC